MLSSLLTRTEAERSPTSAPAGAPLPTLRRRRPMWIVAGMLAACLGALGAVLLWSRATDSATVLQVNRTLYRGEVISAADLSQVSVGDLGGVPAIASDAMAEVVGQQARTDLPSGSLVTPDGIGRPTLPTGRAVLGLRLAEGRAPREELPPGTLVLLVAVDASGAGTADDASAPAYRGVVNRPVEAGSDRSALLVDVEIARQDAEELARLAAQDRLVLVRGDR